MSWVGDFCSPCPSHPTTEPVGPPPLRVLVSHKPPSLQEEGMHYKLL